MTQTQPFQLFANCFPVKGASRSTICDVQRHDFQFIPNSLYDILIAYESKTIEEIKAIFDNQYDEIIEEYFEMLNEKEFIFFTNTPELFPKMSMQWDEPVHITNAIIDINEKSKIDFLNVFQQFEKLGCKYIQIRVFTPKMFDFIQNIIQQAEDLRVISVEFILPFPQNFDFEKWKKLVFDFPRISNIIFHQAKENKTLFESPTGMGNIVKTMNNISSETHCGQISHHYFSLHLKTFTESQHHNTCLNRKISIDQNGNIKNCPSMTESYGNIKDTSLQEALNHPDFKKYWNITKDQINICKDCEFRHICTDCRAYLENPDDIYSKPLKCGYNPYTCEWEDWSTNPLKEKAMKHYGMTTM
jgi:SPASM domain peptide maturase of grasp-with-spasm system